MKRKELLYVTNALVEWIVDCRRRNIQALGLPARDILVGALGVTTAAEAAHAGTGGVAQGCHTAKEA